MANDKSELVIQLNDLDKLKETLRSKAGLAVRKAALDIQAQAQQRAPVDTGALRNSIQARKDASRPFAWEVAVGAEYGANVEYGTTKQAAQPYLTPAVDIVRPQLQAILKEMMDGE